MVNIQLDKSSKLIRMILVYGDRLTALTRSSFILKLRNQRHFGQTETDKTLLTTDKERRIKLESNHGCSSHNS